jgi:hypothetical protein
VLTGSRIQDDGVPSRANTAYVVCIVLLLGVAAFPRLCGAGGVACGLLFGVAQFRVKGPAVAFVVRSVGVVLASLAADVGMFLSASVIPRASNF